MGAPRTWDIFLNDVLIYHVTENSARFIEEASTGVINVYIFEILKVGFYLNIFSLVIQRRSAVVF